MAIAKLELWSHFEFTNDNSFLDLSGLTETRTTRTPAFWGYPRRLMIIHTIESYWNPSQKKTLSTLLSHIGSQVKRRHYPHYWVILDPKSKEDIIHTIESYWIPSQKKTLSTLLSHIGSQVKRRQCQCYKFKELAKISNFETNFTRNMPSKVAW